MVKLNYRKDHVIKNKYSRPGDKLLKLQAVVVHYTANKHANAEDHQKYFDGADGGASRYAGAHIFVDRYEAVEIIPLDEVAYHSNERKAGPLLSSLKATASFYPGGNANLLTLGIEMCIESDGSFHYDTIKRTQEVIRYLQKKFPQLKDTKNRFVRHYDVTGKICPKPFVDSLASWNAFLNGVDNPAPVPKPAPKPVPKKEEVIMAEVKDKEEPSTWAKADWDEMVAEGYFDGTAPKEALTREQGAKVLNQLRKDLLKQIDK